MMKKTKYESAEAAMYAADSYTRMAAIMELRDSMERSDWLRLLGQFWSVCDNIGQNLPALRRQLAAYHGAIPEMMNTDELAALDQLPEVITVYRGCGSINADGCCWSTDKRVAEQFPGLSRYRVSDPVLVEGRVRREDIVALKLDRDEAEIISFRVQVVSTQPLVVPATSMENTGADPLAGVTGAIEVNDPALISALLHGNAPADLVATLKAQN